MSKHSQDDFSWLRNCAGEQCCKRSSPVSIRRPFRVHAFDSNTLWARAIPGIQFQLASKYGHCRAWDALTCRLGFHQKKKTEIGILSWLVAFFKESEPFPNKKSNKAGGIHWATAMPTAPFLPRLLTSSTPGGPEAVDQKSVCMGF